ncbi:acyloxyacyl hydrolase [Tenacibaculum agarivorans]|uniref:acyloxyacyl hydrolase n=1 Tax=Tenacibaculum agarivorans TaxID=1908389 RepID=UPI00094B9379|nr:acyloxyacyl hydrolase [Tenacibaculum agarivorans]
MKRYLFYFCLCFLNYNSLYAQEAKNRYSLGLNYGQASQNLFPLNDSDYLYNNQFLKLQVNYKLTQKQNFNFELLLEPSVYFVNYQLLNEQFIRSETDNYLALRRLYTQRRKFLEYALNIGILLRYNITNNFSSYLLASVGPMVSGADTERLKKGFAFSDVVGLGFALQQNRITFDFRITLRHNSNLDFAFPNSGHNSSGIESGISFQL